MHIFNFLYMYMLHIYNFLFTCLQFFTYMSHIYIFLFYAFTIFYLHEVKITVWRNLNLRGYMPE